MDNANQPENGEIDAMGSGLAQSQVRNRAVNHCYPSFYNQPNFVGNPSVNPFCINTPV